MSTLFDVSEFADNRKGQADAPEIESAKSAFIFSARRIESDLMFVLRGATVDRVSDGEWHISIKGSLPRELYERFKKIMPCIRCRWNGKTHVANHDPKPLLKELIEDGRYPEINPHSFFPTPHDLIDEWLTIADFPSREDWERWQDKGWHGMTDWMVIGDLTAGTGNMLRVAHDRVPDARYEAVEIDPTNRKVLEQCEWLDVVGHDIFQAAPDLSGRYDYLLFNPPFKGEDYCKFIDVALTTLKPNGRAVIITPPSLFSGRSKQVKALRNKLVEGHRCWHLEKHKDFPIEVVCTAYQKPDLRTLRRLYEEDVYGYTGWETYNACLYLDNERELDEWAWKKSLEMAEKGIVDAKMMFKEVDEKLTDTVRSICSGRAEHYSKECPPPISWNETVRLRCVNRYIEKMEEWISWNIEQDEASSSTTEESGYEAKAS